MTRVVVDCGVCGFRAEIAVVREGAATVSIRLSSDCKAVTRWGAAVERLDWREPLGSAPGAGIFWQSAWDTLQHRTCPAPIAVLKAIEVEIGAALAGDAYIRFLPS